MTYIEKFQFFQFFEGCELSYGSYSGGSTYDHVTEIKCENVVLGKQMPDLPSSLQKIFAIDCGLSGSIPLLPSGIHTVDLSGNELTGIIPNLPQSLEVLNLDDNHLTGSIPNLHIKPKKYAEFGIGKGQLQELRLSNNSLNGTISLLPYPNLNVLDLANNDLSGTISSIENYPNYMNLANNRFSGEIVVPEDYDPSNYNIECNHFIYQPDQFCKKQCVGYEEHKNTACGGSNSKLAINCVDPDKCSNFLITHDINKCYNLCNKDENCKGFVKTDVIDPKDPAKIRCSFRKATGIKNKNEGKFCHEKKYIPNFFGCGN